MVMVGAGGACIDALSFFNAKNVMIFDDYKTGSIFGNPIIGTIDDLIRMRPADDIYNCVGSTSDNRTRNRIYEKLKAADLTVKPLLLCSFLSWNVKIGENVLANVGSQIHHDCVIEDNVVISPGAILLGNVHICENSFIGASATLKQGVTIGRNAVVGMCSNVLKDVPPNAVVAGNPARFIKWG